MLEIRKQDNHVSYLIVTELGRSCLNRTFHAWPKHKTRHRPLLLSALEIREVSFDGKLKKIMRACFTSTGIYFEMNSCRAF